MAKKVQIEVNVEEITHILTGYFCDLAKNPDIESVRRLTKRIKELNDARDGLFKQDPVLLTERTDNLRTDNTFGVVIATGKIQEGTSNTHPIKENKAS